MSISQPIFKNLFAYSSSWCVLALVLLIFFQILATFFYISNLNFLFSYWPNNGHMICWGSFTGTHRSDQNNLNRLGRPYVFFLWSGLAIANKSVHQMKLGFAMYSRSAQGIFDARGGLFKCSSHHCYNLGRF